MQTTVRALGLGAGAFLALLVARHAIRERRTMELAGRTVLITGGSRGLGLLLAREFGRHGGRVAICARDPVELDRARHRLERRGVPTFADRCDVTDRDAVDRFVREVETRFGPIDVLVNNASVIQVGPVETMTAHDFEHAMAVNCLGTLYATLAVLPSMRSRRSGRIVNVTSIGGKVAVPHLLPYAAAKFAAVGLSQGMHAELAKHGIRVTTVVPGLMRTGSPVNAFFKGRAAREFTWFSLGDSLRLTSMDAERAARRIVLAARRGETHVTLGWQARLLGLVHELFPGATADALGLFDRMLPGPNGTGTGQLRGMELDSAVAPSRLTSGMNAAAKANNEYGGRPSPAPDHARKVGLHGGR